MLVYIEHTKSEFKTGQSHIWEIDGANGKDIYLIWRALQTQECKFEYTAKAGRYESGEQYNTTTNNAVVQPLNVIK